MYKIDKSSAPSMVLVQVIQTGSMTRRLLEVELFAEDTISRIKSRISESTKIDPGMAMKLIFCGRALDDNTKIASLDLGPMTNLTAKVSPSESTVDASWSYITPETPSNEIDCGDYSSFYVFCKPCAKVQRGKLRAYCKDCSSSAVVFITEPEQWNDVFNSATKLFVECKSCDAERNVEICFKCVECGDVSTPLTHVKRNSKHAECVICGETKKVCVNLNCLHVSCIECFAAYCETLHSQHNLIFKPQVGYTVGCPVYECPAYVTDVHHFYMLGVEAYQRYQRMAAQMFFARQTERQYCTYPECAAAFILEEIDDESKMVLCPECSKLFCRFCQLPGRCKCDEKIETLDESLVKKISKQCPTCKAPTERTGGCSHIHCTQCQSEWCFVCLRLWSDECQWDHWFE